MKTVATSIAEDIDSTGDKIRYDQQVKKVLANRPVLSRILKFTVAELKNYSLPTIGHCISKNIDISSVYVNPGETNTKILSEPVKDIIEGEGKIIYDIKFHILTPDGKKRKIIINIEAQQKSNPGYDIVARAIFYCSRLISSQLKVEFNNNGSDNTNYDNIKKVYTIWICMDCPINKQDSIISFDWHPNIVYQGTKELSVDYRYDIMNVTIIHLSKLGSESKDQLIGMLDTLFDTTMTASDKKNRLENVHGLPMSIELEKEVTDMCNLSSGIENRGVEKGKMEILQQLVKDKLLSIADAAKQVNKTEEEFLSWNTSPAVH